jgi:hypothetical protein
MLNTQATALPYDDLYEALIAAHQGLSTEQSHALNARLVLLLANQVGDLDTLRSAFLLARAGAAPQSGTPVSDKAAITPVAPAHAS